MELGYWKSQGLAQSARYLAKCKGAAELGITFKDYDFTEGPQWFGTDKPKMAEKTAFPNLPYLSTSDGKVVTQSGAMATISKKTNPSPTLFSFSFRRNQR